MEIALVTTPKSESNLISKYGLDWSPQESLLTIELACFKMGRTVEQGGLGQENHFREAVNLLWGPTNERKHFVWNPWSDKMLEEALKHKYLSVAGPATSGKSLFYAIYAIINWLCDPINTTVLVTSTSLKESKGRIWADIEEWWNAAQHHTQDALPGKLVSSLGLIKFEDPSGEWKVSDRSGIHLIAGEKGKEKESIGKMIGYKNRRLIFIADELPDLSPAILEAATSNLDSTEKEVFQLVGIGNPNSIYDPHGIFSKPQDGWRSVSPAVFEWPTDLGYCIRFDALKSPNILADRVIYPWLPTQEKVDEAKGRLGEDSLAFWRMWRGFWCPTGGTESVVSEADIIGFECEKTTVRWKNGTVQIVVSFLDPGFTNGGDRSIAYYATFGLDGDTEQPALLYEEFVPLFEDITNKGVSRNFQIVHQWRDLCIKRGVTPDHAAVDDTGASAFGDIVHTEWSRLVTRINFGGKATATQVSAHDKTLSCDKYANRVTEIWCSMREYMRGGQIRGICPDLGTELTSRRMVQKKSGVELKSQVEPKPIMRSRTGKSPDVADAALGILDFLRSKFQFRAMARIKLTSVTSTDWKKFTKKNDFNSKHGSFLNRAA